MQKCKCMSLSLLLSSSLLFGVSFLCFLLFFDVVATRLDYLEAVSCLI